MESSVQRVLTKDDFAWLDLPPPVPLDTVRNAPADQLLSLVGEAAFISDMVAPLIDPRPSTGNFQTGVGSNMLTSAKLVPRKGASAAWLDELNDILAAQQLIAVTKEQHVEIHTVSMTFHDMSMSRYRYCLA